MKKKLEADLISIAHRVLQIKNKSDINQLFLETQKLYEKLAILRFVEEHFSDAKPTIGQAEVVEKMKAFFETISLPQFQQQPTIVADAIENNAISPSVEEVITPAAEESFAPSNDAPIAIEEPLTPAAEINEDQPAVEDIIPEAAVVEPAPIEVPIEKPLFALDQTEVESTKTESPKKKEIVQISFDDLLGGHYPDPEFVKVGSSDKSPSANKTSAPQSSIATPSADLIEDAAPKVHTLNDKLAKEINIGLNDRIAFVKHLFGGNNEDYNRVISQLITFDNYPETKAFIDEMVKPDYNNWEGKEEYEHRFIEIIEKKFLSF